MSRKKRGHHPPRRASETAVAEIPASTPHEADRPPTTVLVVPRVGIIGWVVAEACREADFVAPDARTVRAAEGPEWRRDVPGAASRPVAELETAGRMLLLGVCPDEQHVFAGMSPQQILADPDVVGCAGLPELLAGDRSFREPPFGASPGTLTEMVWAIWILVEADVFPAAEAEAACRFLARTALARFRAGHARQRDMNVLWLRDWHRRQGRAVPHGRLLNHAVQHLAMARRAAERDWRANGRIVPAAGPQGTLRVAVCTSRVPQLVDWLFDAEAPHVVLRLDDGRFFCRADKNSGITLHRAVASWRRAVLGRPPTEQEEDALERHGRPFGSPIDFWSDDCTAGNSMLANPHLPQVALDPEQIVEMLISSFAAEAQEW